MLVDNLSSSPPCMSKTAGRRVDDERTERSGLTEISMSRWSLPLFSTLFLLLFCSHESALLVMKWNN